LAAPKKRKWRRNEGEVKRGWGEGVVGGQKSGPEVCGRLLPYADLPIKERERIGREEGMAKREKRPRFWERHSTSSCQKELLGPAELNARRKKNSEEQDGRWKEGKKMKPEPEVIALRCGTHGGRERRGTKNDRGKSMSAGSGLLVLYRHEKVGPVLGTDEHKGKNAVRKARDEIVAQDTQNKESPGLC